jgi:hypothetical protein
MDADIDFGALFAEFDTFLMGRRTFAVAGAMGSAGSGAKTFVFSRTLRPEEHPKVTVVPLLPHPAQQTNLVLTGHRVYKTGVVSLEYAVKKPRRGGRGQSSPA